MIDWEKIMESDDFIDWKYEYGILLKEYLEIKKQNDGLIEMLRKYIFRGEEE